MGCAFKKNNGECKALTITECKGCKFYLTQEELDKRRQKVVKWCENRGIDYSDYVREKVK